MNTPDGWVKMFGPQGWLCVPPEMVAQYEREGYWRADKMPTAQEAPGEAIPADTERGTERNADF